MTTTTTTRDNRDNDGEDKSKFGSDTVDGVEDEDNDALVRYNDDGDTG